MKKMKLIVKTDNQKYPIIIGSDLIIKTASIIKNNSIQFNKCLLVIDKNIPKKVVNGLKKSLKNKEIFLIFIKVNEKKKN